MEEVGILTSPGRVILHELKKKIVVVPLLLLEEIDWDDRPLPWISCSLLLVENHEIHVWHEIADILMETQVSVHLQF